MSGQLNELRLQVERLDYDNKESIITIDILKEQNQDAKNELEEFKKTITELKSSQKDASADDKEKRKQEKMAMMMAKFDSVMITPISGESMMVIEMSVTVAILSTATRACQIMAAPMVSPMAGSERQVLTLQSGQRRETPLFPA